MYTHYSARIHTQYKNGQLQQFQYKSWNSQTNSLIHLHILYLYYMLEFAKSMCDLNVVHAVKLLELEYIADSPIDILCASEWYHGQNEETTGQFV